MGLNVQTCRSCSCRTIEPGSPLSFARISCSHAHAFKPAVLASDGGGAAMELGLLRGGGGRFSCDGERSRRGS